MSFRRRLELSFAAILAFALATGLAAWLQNRAIDGFARAINLCGSQRMRSWHIAVLANEWAARAEPATAAALERELARFAAILEGLRRGDAALGLKPPPKDVGIEFALTRGGDFFADLEPRVRRLLGTTGDAARAEAEGIVTVAGEQAARMDSATAGFEAAAARTLERYGRIQLGLFFATVAIALAAFDRLRRYVLLRLPRLEEALHELGRGHLGDEVHNIGGADELDRLERTFNETSHELEHARATILAHEAALVRADRMKTEFLATMSHELRTPLTSVIGFAELLRDGVYGPVEPRQRERLDTIVRNARGLLALIGDLLDVARIEAGRVDLHLAPADPGAIVHDVAATLRPLADAKKLALEVAVADGLAAVKTDADRVRQIVLNLGANAVKFTACGTVRISAAAAPGGGVRVEVSDTGPGIAPEALPRLFQRFEQLDASATRRHGGTGLGLYISKRLADLLGARIDVESTPGTGSRFALTLPGFIGDESHAATQPEAQADPRR